MAVQEPDKRKIYIIPDNFVDEARIINGMFRRRFFIEGVVLALVAAFFALLIPASSVSTRIIIVISIAAPFLLLGVAGIGGDPLSVAMKNIFSWFSHRNPILYDSSIRVLERSPLDKMMDETPARDQILDMIEAHRQRQLEERLQKEYIKGQTFEFASDKDVFRKYIDIDKEIEHEDVAVILDFDEDEEVWVNEFGAAVSQPVPFFDSNDAQDDWDKLDFLDDAEIVISTPSADITEEDFFNE